jgi:hypothetical protein
LLTRHRTASPKTSVVSYCINIKYYILLYTYRRFTTGIIHTHTHTHIYNIYMYLRDARQLTRRVIIIWSCTVVYVLQCYMCTAQGTRLDWPSRPKHIHSSTIRVYNILYSVHAYCTKRAKIITSYEYIYIYIYIGI